MTDINKYLEDRLRAVEITCPACEEPEPADAGDGPYITWRKAGVDKTYASGWVWMTNHRIELTLFSPLCTRADADRVSREILRKLLEAFDHQADGVRYFISAANLRGDHVASIDRRAYDMVIIVREE